jgi:hypothetical protein
MRSPILPATRLIPLVKEIMPAPKAKEIATNKFTAVLLFLFRADRALTIPVNQVVSTPGTAWLSGILLADFGPATQHLVVGKRQDGSWT